MSTARFLEEYADFLESHIESWTVTNEGFLVPGIKRHYVRINPVGRSATRRRRRSRSRRCASHSQPSARRTPSSFRPRKSSTRGFLELVRYGIRKAGDSLIEDSLRVIDAVLKTDFPAGPCWHRYTHDGYGQRDDGGPFLGWGAGRPWPLLTGERGHYELAAGRDVDAIPARDGKLRHLDAAFCPSKSGISPTCPER